MAVSSTFGDLIKDELDELGGIEIKRMFGGAGVFKEGLMFGLITDDTLYFKVDDGNRPDFEAEEMKPFTYSGKKRPVQMSYWTAPEYLFDDRDDMLSWARKAYDAALRTKKK